MDNFRTIVLLPAYLVAICNALCCHGRSPNTEERASQPEPFAHERLQSQCRHGSGIDCEIIAAIHSMATLLTGTP